MKLKNKILLLSDYTGRSKLDIWQECKKGDTLILELETEGKSASYIVYVDVLNTRTNETYSTSLLNLTKGLKHLKYEEID